MRKEKASFLCLLSDDCELDHRRMDNVINEFVENAPIKGIKIKYGIYKNIDKNLSIATIYDYASMAAETVMEDYNHDYAYYTDELAQKSLYNQMIENDFTDETSPKRKIIHLEGEVQIEVLPSFEDKEAVEEKTIKRRTNVWMVSGHLRHYKSGKVIFISSYPKGPERDKKKPKKKDYDLPQEDDE